MSKLTILTRCPCCQTDMRKPEDASLRVVCTHCTRKKKIYSFCGACQREWVPPSSQDNTNSCGRPGCGLRAALISRGNVDVGQQSRVYGCPYFRACPGCHALLTHNGVGCPSIRCPQCGIGFCFRCLKPGYCSSCSIVDNSKALKALGL